MKSALLALATLAACAGAPPKVHLDDTWPAKAPGYKDANAAWTRQKTAWSNLAHIVDVAAVLKAPEWRAAYVAEKARREQMSPDAAAELASKERAAAGTGWEVTLMIATAKGEWNDLAKKDRSMWRIALVGDDGREVLPTSVLPDKRPRDVIRAYHPAMGMFSKAYTVTFPRAAPDGRRLVGRDSPRIALRFASALASVELIWDARR